MLLFRRRAGDHDEDDVESPTFEAAVLGNWRPFAPSKSEKKASES